MPYRSRERVEKALAHQQPDRVPVCSPMDQEAMNLVAGMGLPDDHRAMCAEGDVVRVTIDQTPVADIFAQYLEGLPEGGWISMWGYGRSALKSADGYHAGHKYVHSLRNIDTVEGLEDYPFPDLSAPWRTDGLADRIAGLKADGYTVSGQMSQTILETAYLMRGLEQLMIDFYERREYVQRLFEKLCEQRCTEAGLLIEAGADLIRIGDDIAMQHGLIVGVELYRKRIKPFHKSVIEAVRAAAPDMPVLYHSDGNLKELLPELIEIGVTAINPVQPECMDIAAIKKEFGDDLVLWGCMPVQSIFETGTPDDVRRHIELLMTDVAPGGGLIVEFTNMIVTDKVLANLRVFFDEFWEAGRLSA